MVQQIRQAEESSLLTPDIVAKYAGLMLTDDNGLPIVPAEHHKLWLRLVCDERIKKLLIISPPESAKTTWLINAYVSCRVGFYPEQSIIIGSVSDDVATKRSVSVRTLTESQMWQTIFPEILPVKSMWEQQAWTVAKNGKSKPGAIHRTVTAYGTGASIIGSRGDLIIGDDLLDFDNTRTDNQRRFVEEWIHNSFLSRRKSGNGRTILIGTSWNAADYYATIRKNDLGWVICHTPLFEDDGFYAYITYPDDWQYTKLGEPMGEANASHV